MANAFKCDVCGRMHEGRPHEVEGWAALPLAQSGKPRYDSIKCVNVVELCGECTKGAEERLKAFAVERREQTQATITELTRLANMAG